MTITDGLDNMNALYSEPSKEQRILFGLPDHFTSQQFMNHLSRSGYSYAYCRGMLNRMVRERTIIITPKGYKKA